MNVPLKKKWQYVHKLIPFIDLKDKPIIQYVLLVERLTNTNKLKSLLCLSRKKRYTVTANGHFLDQQEYDDIDKNF